MKKLLGAGVAGAGVLAIMVLANYLLSQWEHELGPVPTRAKARFLHREN